MGFSWLLFLMKGKIAMNYIKKLFTPYRGLPREVYIIFISRIVNAAGCFVMPLLTIILTQRIGLSESEAGIYISASGIIGMAAALIGGKLADTIGRKILIVIFDSLAALLYIVCGLMPLSMNVIYVLMLAGAVMSIAGPAHDSMIADLTTPANRDGAYALTYMGWNIGYAVGPVVGGLLYEKHLPLVFIGDAVTALLSLSLIVIFIKDTLGKSREVIGDKGRELEKAEEGSIISVLLSRPLLLYFALIIFGYNFAYSQWSFMMPMHMTRNFGEASGTFYYGIIASLNGAIVMVLTPFITKLVKDIENMRRIVYGGLIYAVGFGMLGIFSSLEAFFISVFTFTIGEIVLSISVSPFIANHTPSSHRGRMSSVLPLIMYMGHIVGPMGMGKLITYIGMDAGWIFVGLFTLVSAVFMRRLETYEKRTKEVVAA
jgi:MFS family permease